MSKVISNFAKNATVLIISILTLAFMIAASHGEEQGKTIAGGAERTQQIKKLKQDYNEELSKINAEITSLPKDTVRLKSGGEVIGRIIKRTDALVTIEVSSGGTFTLRGEDITSIKQISPQEAERLETLWAKKQEVIKKYENRFRSAGLIKYGRDWITNQEYRALLAEKERKKELKELKKRELEAAKRALLAEKKRAEKKRKELKKREWEAAAKYKYLEKKRPLERRTAYLVLDTATLYQQMEDYYKTPVYFRAEYVSLYRNSILSNHVDFDIAGIRISVKKNKTNSISILRYMSKVYGYRIAIYGTVSQNRTVYDYLPSGVEYYVEVDEVRWLKATK